MVREVGEIETLNALFTVTVDVLDWAVPPTLSVMMR
jgi:hypothetical protein